MSVPRRSSLVDSLSPEVLICAAWRVQRVSGCPSWDPSRAVYVPSRESALV